MKTAFQAATPRPLEPGRVRRARAYPRPGRLLLVAFLLLMAYVGIAAFAVSVVQLFWLDDKQYGIHALVGLGVFVACRLTAFVLARSLTCPLCHGTVMHEKRCRKHAEAFRIPTLTYRFSAVLSILLTWGFRCMYCGTQYRLRR